MVILVKIVGILFLVLGLAIFAVPQITQKIFDFIKEDSRIYYAGVARSILGIILFFAASESYVPLAAIALGLMFVVSGIVVFTLDLEKIKALIAAYLEMPGIVIRLLGLVVASFGILVYSLW